MPSIVSGYEYDIFISYRQKDNKYDGWVSDFVTNLKKELEATFKEEVSVYFDENPHDGILETSNVNKSLEGKLKCAVFIPIVSQTYCDPNSFAWQNEFLVFVKMARGDEFGTDVKLTSGNVTSRILPVRIHEIDADDRKMLETELGGPLRQIDFIYKAAGVNRPLRSNEDSPANNLTKIFYRDQINKVANTARSIIDGMRRKHLVTEPSAGKAQINSEPIRQSKNLKIVYAILLIGLIAGTYYFFRGYKHSREVLAIRNGSIAILPFENQTGKPELNSVGQVAADFISTRLIQHKFFKVIPTQDIFRQTVYSGVVTNPEAEKKIVDQGKADYLVLGHYNLIGDSILLVISVNDVAEKSVLYTTPVIKCAVANPMAAVSDAQQFILGYLLYSSSEKEITAHSPKYDAYLEYMKGMELWTKNNMGPGNIGVRQTPSIENHFRNSIAFDQNFLPPFFQLTELYGLDRRFRTQDSIMQILESKRPLFSEMEKLKYEVQRLSIAKDWMALENLLLSKVEMTSADFQPYFQLGSIALIKQNKPRKALEYLNQCDLSLFDFENKPADQLYYSVKALAHLRLKEFNEVIKMTDNLSFTPFVGLLAKRWLALYYSGNPEQANKELDVFLPSARPDEPQNPGMSLFRAAQLKGDSAYMLGQYHRYKQFLIQWDDQTLSRTWYPFIKAVMMFRVHDQIAESEKILSGNIPLVARQRRIHQLALLYASTGREQKAREVMSDLLSHESKYDNGSTRYYCAKVEAELGNKEKAMDYLKEAIEKGMDFGEELFEFDGDFGTLIDYPPFIELTRPKG